MMFSRRPGHRPRRLLVRHRGSIWPAPLLALVLAVIVILAGIYAWRVSAPPTGRAEPPVLDSEARPWPVQGQLSVSLFGQDASGDRKPVLHWTSFANGPDYAGMEDNDLRGFLDGNFKKGWAQVSQVHVRLGRRPDGPQYGEHELFRVLQRWEGIRLPAGAVVSAAQLRLHVEVGPAAPLSVMLYSVNKDWNPGVGGTLRNNTSPPVPGEVWWGEAAHQERDWGLPGVGFAADAHPEADTPAQPLAYARYQPGAATLEFSGEALAAYIGDRVRAGQPLLFLLKLSDVDEDGLARQLQVYSGNTGANRKAPRRPSLDLQWSSAAEWQTLRRSLLLEPGRDEQWSMSLPSSPMTVAASFEANEGSAAPWLTLRTREEGQWSAWRRLAAPMSVQGDLLEVRAAAVTDPVELGQAFVADLHDPWIRTAPPEEQVVPWTFVAPSGDVTTVAAAYRGDYRWEISFVPDEIGRWRYRWSQDFTEFPYTSVPAHFDVVPGRLENVMAQLAALRDEIVANDGLEADARYALYEVRLLKLERAALARLTPERFRGPEGDRLRTLLNEVRTAIGGEPVPVPMPLEAWDRGW